MRIIHLAHADVCDDIAAKCRAEARRCNGAPRNAGTGSIINYEGHTVSQLGDRPGVLLGDLDLTAVRKIRTAWNPVYGLPYRYPAAYKRLRGLPVGASGRGDMR